MISKTLNMLGDVQAVLRARYYLRSAETMGPRVRVWGSPVVTNEGTLRIGNRVRFISTVATLQIGVGPGALLEIEDGVVINYGCSIGVLEHIRIGKRSRFGTHVTVIDNSFHQLNPERRTERPPSRPVIIEENVWLASRVMILPGVTIGQNSVVGAGSIVTRDVPANVLVAGSPAKVLRSVYDKEPERRPDPGS